MQFKHTQLDNGLTIVAEVNPDSASMAAGFFVKTGSRDETAEISGVSHFLEHMVFKGTERRSAFDVNLAFDRMGAHYNAFTSEENTVFFGSVLPEFQEPLLDLLSDILRPSLRQEDFDVEKGVIVDEIALYEDQPKFRVYDKMMSTHFADHPLGRCILGTPETIRKLRREQMQDYFDRRYSAGNITLVAVGNLDFDALVARAETDCAAWKSFDVTRQTPPAGASRTNELITDEKVTREHIGLMSAGPSRQCPERFAAELLAAIIGDTTGSRMYYGLVEKAIADEASMSYAPMDGAGGMMTFISCQPQRACEALTIARKVLADFQADGPNETELQAAKNKIASAATLKGELPMGRLAAVGLDWTYRGEYMPLSEQIEQLLAVTAEQVHQVAREFDISATTLVALGPATQL